MWHWFAQCGAPADTWRRGQQSNNGGVIILGLILLVIVAIFGVAVVVSNPGVHELSLFRVLVPVTYGGIFFTGVGATVVAVLARHPDPARPPPGPGPAQGTEGAGDRRSLRRLGEQHGEG